MNKTTLILTSLLPLCTQATEQSLSFSDLYIKKNGGGSWSAYEDVYSLGYQADYTIDFTKSFYFVTNLKGRHAFNSYYSFHYNSLMTGAGWKFFNNGEYSYLNFLNLEVLAGYRESRSSGEFNGRDTRKGELTYALRLGANFKITDSISYSPIATIEPRSTGNKDISITPLRFTIGF